MPDTTPQTGSPLRWKSGVVILLAGVTWLAGTDAFMPDQTFRIIGIYYGTVAWIGAALIWWLFFSGVSVRKRLIVTVAAVAAMFAGWFALVHRLEFDGAMAPRIVWRWQDSADEKRSTWLNNRTVQPVHDPELEKPFDVTSQDWPRYCSADGSRIIREPLTERNWTTSPPVELWRHPVGEGWSSFAVVGPRLYTQEQRDDQECIVCYHTTTGTELWVHQDSVRYETAMGGIGPRATPTVTHDALYAVGATGLLNCLDPVTGAPRWQRSLTADAETDMPMWGYSCSPLIWNDTVIVVPGGTSDRGVLACDCKTGEPVWGSGNHHAGYSSPRIESLNGAPTLLVFQGDGLDARDPDTGRLLWNYPMTNMYQVNVAQPILTGQRLFIGTGYDGHCVALDLDNITNGRPAEAWPPNRNLNLKFNEAVAFDGFVYGLDDGILCCIDPATGKRKWKGGRYNFGQVLLWDDTLLVQAEKGYVALVAASPERYEEITRFPALSDHEDASPRTWNVPVVNKQRLFIRSDREAACYELPPVTDR